MRYYIKGNPSLLPAVGLTQ